MGRYDYDGPSAGPACERCGVVLTETDWVRLKAIHQGTSSERYRDSEKRVCVDCLAAIGMLEIETDSSRAETSVRLRDRLEPIRGLGR